MKKILALVFCMMLIASSAYAESVTLNILSENEPSWEYAFMQKHPEIEVRHMDAAAEGQAYLTLLMTDNGCDVYELPIGPLYEALKEKGYLLPIEGSDVMDAFAAQLCGYMKPMFLKDNLIYAAPVPSEEDLVESISWGMWRYARDLWEEEGLGAFPATYGELLTRMIEWEKNEDDHGYRLFDAELGPGGFASTILQAYVRQYEKSNEIISFDTPIFREVMLLLKEYQDVYQPLNDCQALISSYCGYLAESCDEGYDKRTYTLIKNPNEPGKRRAYFVKMRIRPMFAKKRGAHETANHTGPVKRVTELFLRRSSPSDTIDLLSKHT